MGIEKKGQIQLSFSVIFSVIIIVATLAIASYVIYKVYNTTNDLTCRALSDDLQKQIDQVWQADDGTSNQFKESVPASTQKVCFGYINQTIPADKDALVHDAVKNFVGSSDNMLFYPRTACSGKFSFSLKHVKTDSFFCVAVVNKQITAVVSKGSFDALASICPQSKPDCGINAQRPASNNTITPVNNTTVNVEVDENVCLRAQNNGLCNALDFTYKNLYKYQCCSKYNTCC